MQSTISDVDPPELADARRPIRRLSDAERGEPVEDLAYLIHTSGSTGRPKGLATGYLGCDDLTDSAFIPDFLGIAGKTSGRIYRTGDSGGSSRPGRSNIWAGSTFRSRSRGHRIDLEEIESALRHVPDVTAAVVSTRWTRHRASGSW